MAKRHILEIYGCTHDRFCVGCFDSDDPEPADDSLPPAPAAPSPGTASAVAGRSATPSSAPADDGPAPTPRPVLLNARWRRAESDASHAAAGEELRLVAQAHGLTAPTATITARNGATGAEEALSGTVDGEAVSTTWTAPEAGTYRFDVEADGARATSPDLVVESDRPPLKLVHIGKVLRELLHSSRVVARWYLEDLSYEFLCSLAEQGDADPENDPVHMPRELCLLPGMEGEDVREAQRALTALGHAVEATGAFDAATTAAMLAWLATVQPDREVDGSGTRVQVPEDDTFAGLCSSHRITDWADLWEDQGPGLDDDPDLPGRRSFSVPSRAQRGRGHDLLEASGRGTSPAYGGLAYVPPVERVTRTLVFEDGVVVELPSWFHVDSGTGNTPRQTGAFLSLYVPRGAAPPEMQFQERSTELAARG